MATTTEAIRSIFLYRFQYESFEFIRKEDPLTIAGSVQRQLSNQLEVNSRRLPSNLTEVETLTFSVVHSELQNHSNEL